MSLGLELDSQEIDYLIDLGRQSLLAHPLIVLVVVSG